MQTFKFSGHETFICKHFWPKKGVDFLLQGNSFNDEDAVVKLGVGKNMVSSIRFWLKALGLIDDEEKLTEFSAMIFNDDGFDPYIEDIGTIWLLHYNLITTGYASMYNIVFNQFLKGRTEFTRINLLNYLKRINDSLQLNFYNEHTVQSDISVFIRNYSIPKLKSIKQNVEDEFSGLFNDLELASNFERRDINNKGEEYFQMERKKRPNLPKEIFLFTILNSIGSGTNISFNELVSGNNSVGNIFLLSRDGIYEKIEELLYSYDFISFSKTAGNLVLQINTHFELNQLLGLYYEK